MNWARLLWRRAARWREGWARSAVWWATWRESIWYKSRVASSSHSSWKIRCENDNLVIFHIVRGLTKTWIFIINSTATSCPGHGAWIDFLSWSFEFSWETNRPGLALLIIWILEMMCIFCSGFEPPFQTTALTLAYLFDILTSLRAHFGYSSSSNALRIHLSTFFRYFPNVL